MTWYNSNWNYRKAITISNSGSSLTDYQTLITIDTASLISSTKMRSDCGDIRFTSSDGSTIINYWIESGINSASTKIWVKIPSIANGNNTIYLYYGNSSATTTSSGTNTFNFFENFDDGDISDWTMTNHNQTVSSSSSADNTYYISSPYSLKIYNYANCTVPPYSGGETRMSKTVSLSNGTYIADLYQKMTGMRYWKCEFGNTHIGVLFYINDVSYFSRYCAPGTCTIMTTCDTQLGTSSSFTITTGSAKISLSAYSGDCNYNTGWFDDVRIRKYISPEPTFSSIGTEETQPNITATNMTIIPSETPCRNNICTVTVNVTWTNNGGSSGSFVPNITIDTVAIVPAPYPSQELTPSANVTKSFVISNLVTGTRNICPSPN